MALVLLGVAGTLAMATFIALAYRRHWVWTGFASRTRDSSEPQGKTLWDWLQLLIVPVALALAAFGLSVVQSRRDRAREDARIAHERRTADDRDKEAALGTYLQQVSDLILEHGLRSRPGRREADPSDEQALARTLTLTVLRRLDGKRKALVLQFLDEAGLIRSERDYYKDPDVMSIGPDPKVGLAGADLRRLVLAGLGGAVIRPRDPDSEITTRVASANLSRVDLREAQLQHAVLVGVDLSGADLRRADFRGAALDRAVFEGADLRGADFTGAFLTEADFSGACLSGARFRRAAFGPSRTGANFRGAAGTGVDFSGARLERADFRGAELSGLRLRGASLSGARLPKGWTDAGLRMSAAENSGLCRYIVDKYR